jgi:hypothetical protein
MSFGDVYTLPPGAELPGPPLDLPKVEGTPARPRIVITPDPKRRPAPTPTAETDPWAAAGFTSAPPAAPGAPASVGEKGLTPPASGDASDPWAAAGFTAEPPPPSRTVTKLESTLRGVGTGLTFGSAPALAGLAEASGMPELPREEDLAAMDPSTGMTPNAGRFLGGAFNMIRNWVSDHPDPKVTEAYHRGREAALSDQNLAQEQHPLAYFLGMLGGAALGPKFGGLGPAATWTGRFAQGARAGAAGGTAYGAGTALSEGKSAPEVIEDAGKGAALGIAIGGPFGAALGPRLAATGSAGARAARTAEDLGAPLPRELTSDSRLVQGTTAKLRSVPFVGSKVAERVEATQEAAGNRVGQIADTMTGGVTDRAAADALVRGTAGPQATGLRGVIEANRARIDRLYTAVRGQIDENAQFTMPRTQATLARIRANRAAAGHPDPGRGLEQFDNVSQGATFNGAHRARVDAREAGNPTAAHPGYNAADYNQLTRAMTTDLRDMVGAAAARHAGGTPANQRAAATSALRAFDEAERAFGPIAEQNRLLSQLVDARGEGAISALLGAARDQGGNLRLLAQLRQSMPRQEFEQIGGTLLAELGQNRATGEFSLAQFTTNWNKVSDRAKGVLFPPQSRAVIDDIAAMGAHIKGALRESNTSHTASVIVLLDIAKDAALLGADIASGGLGVGSAVGAGSSAAAVMLGRWLAAPASAASIGAWRTAYQAAFNSPTPARVAAFNVATRNLAHNLNVPAERVLQLVHARTTGTEAPAAEHK